MATRITIARSWQELESLRPLWEDLYSVDFGGTFFQSYQWNLAAARNFTGREEPFVVAIENESGAAIIPTCIAGERLKFLGDELFDYPGALYAGDPKCAQAALGELARLRLSMEVHGLRTTNSPWADLPTEPFSGAPYVERGLSTDEFIHRHTRSARQLRRLQRMGVRPRRYTAGHRALINFIYLAKGKHENSLFRDPLRRAFMEEIALCDAVETEIFTLETASALVAAIVTFRDRDVRRFYTTYFSEAWSRYSPGAALLFRATECSLAEGLACDYMTGEHSYKLRLATGIVPLYRLPRIRLDHFYAERELALAS